jgi:uncharacterized protein YndB with AHSA1/START domain
MRPPEGRDFWSKGVFREIIEPERVVCTDFFADEQGNPVEPARYGMSPDWPKESLVTVTFAGHEGKPKFTLHYRVGSAPASERAMCQAGWTELLDRLAGYLAEA